MSAVSSKPDSLKLIPEVTDWSGAVRGKFAERENVARVSRPVTLFDDKERECVRPSLRAETTYSYYDRTCLTGFGHLREMLQRWLRRLPPKKQRDIAKRMRHTGRGSHARQRSFDAAFFELFLHEFLVGTGGHVVVDPTVAGLTPDFGVTERNPDGSGVNYVVEATDVNVLSGTEMDADWNEGCALDALDEIDSPDYYLSVRTTGQLSSTPRKKDLKKPFQQLVKDSDYDRVFAIAELHGFSKRTLPAAQFKHEGWQILGHLLPVARDRRPKKGRFVGIDPIKGGMLGSSSKVKKRLYEKVKRYREVDNLIIALRSDWNLGREDLAEALFGTLAHTFFVPKPGFGARHAPPSTGHVSQNRDGFWFNSHGPQNQNVIGVVMFPSLYPQNIDEATATYFANPYLDSPLPGWASEIGHAEYENGNVRFAKGAPVGSFAMDHVHWLEAWEIERDAGART